MQYLLILTLAFLLFPVSSAQGEDLLAKKVKAGCVEKSKGDGKKTQDCVDEFNQAKASCKKERGANFEVIMSCLIRWQDSKTKQLKDRVAALEAELAELEADRDGLA